MIVTTVVGNTLEVKIETQIFENRTFKEEALRGYFYYYIISPGQ